MVTSTVRVSMFAFAPQICSSNSLRETARALCRCSQRRMPTSRGVSGMIL